MVQRHSDRPVDPGWLESGRDPRPLADRLRPALGAALLAAALVGCANTPRVDVVSDPALRPAQHATYRFHEPLHTDRETGEGTVLSERLRSPAARELAARGRRRVDFQRSLSRFKPVRFTHKQGIAKQFTQPCQPVADR